MPTPVRGRWVKASKRRGMWISRMESQEPRLLATRLSSRHWLLRWTVLRVRDAGSGLRVIKRQHGPYDYPAGSRPVGPTLLWEPWASWAARRNR
jgi:hypothetical protein